MPRNFTHFVNIHKAIMKTGRALLQTRSRPFTDGGMIMNMMAVKIRGHIKTARRKHGATVRIPIAFTVLTFVISMLPGAYIMADYPAEHAVLSGSNTEGSNSAYWQDGRPQGPGVPVDRNAGQSRPSGQSSEHFTPEVLVTSSSDYRIGANDVIEIRVDKAPDLSGIFRVNSAGTILLNYLGRVTAQNKTPEELAQFISDRLRGDYIKEPHVVIEVKQYNSRAFYVQGAVRTPGLYHIEGSPSLMKLIIIAGGLADDHGSTAYIIREIKPEERMTEAPQTVVATAPDAASEGKATYELIKRNINGLLKGAFDQDLTIEPGDVVNIPSTEVFFVAGEVHAPGSFPLKEGTSLRQAISLAQGTTPNAAPGRAIIFREDQASGKRQEISVDVSEVMKGKKEDIAIMPNDTIIIPNSRLKSVRNTLLSAFGYGLVRTGRLPGRY